MTGSTSTPTESTTTKIIRVGLLIGLAILACLVMSLDPNEPY